MSPIIYPDEKSVWNFLYRRSLAHPKFENLIAVSVRKYPGEFSATVWVGRKPDKEMSQHITALEDELREQGISCSILLKSDKELPHGGKYPLNTSKGAFIYRYYRVEALGDEDFVYVFNLSNREATYRFRVSLTGTLSSMLRSRKLFEENRMLDVYLGEIKHRIEAQSLEPEELQRIMFSSNDFAKFDPGTLGRLKQNLRSLEDDPES